MVVKINMARRLSLEETKNYLKAWREFADKEALEILMTCNGGLVGFFSKKYLGKSLTIKK